MASELNVEAFTFHPTSAFHESQRFAHRFPVAPSSFWLDDALGKILHETVSPPNVGLLAVVSHPLKLTALAVAAVVAFVALVAVPAVVA